MLVKRNERLWGYLPMKDRSGLTVDTARNMMAAGFDSVNPPFAQHFLSRAGVAQWQSNGFVNRRSVVQPHSPAPFHS